ncbi:hypothetical protein [Ketogulonicigenium vulgare]|uniref:hypothetical protein n=1 Tax=Ketogulonicigenium vulgare TaxID=92945 RepID=UPI002359A069|nr:hypothetical protein [Ketogulonicigenium vulgare]
MTQHIGPAHLREMDEAEPSNMQKMHITAESSGAPDRAYIARPNHKSCGLSFDRPAPTRREYVRADLFDAVTRQRDQMQAEIDRLTTERDYDRRQSAHKDIVIDRLNKAYDELGIELEIARAALKGGAE